nr:hypothetical protein [uncultured Methanospirillum sp.]
MRNYQLPVHCCFILLLCFGVAGVGTGDTNISQETSTLDENSVLSDTISSTGIIFRNESDALYEIKVVSPELLKKIQINSGAGDQILKAGPGITLGISTPHVLYIRGDLQSDEYLLKNRNDTDTKDKISDHMIAILFGRDNANITLLQTDLDYMFWFDEEYSSDDINTTIAFARAFNNLSTTTQFEDESVLKGELKNNYEKIPYHYYQIKITTRQFLDNYKKDKYKSSSEELLNDKSGRLVGILAPGYVYLWDGLEGKDRRYFITKSLLWNLGLHGETSTEPDSFFYTRANFSAMLSDLDKDAIKLLYGGRLMTGMKADAIRKALDISL